MKVKFTMTKGRKRYSVKREPKDVLDKRNEKGKTKRMLECVFASILRLLLTFCEVGTPGTKEVDFLLLTTSVRDSCEGGDRKTLGLQDSSV